MDRDSIFLETKGLISDFREGGCLVINWEENMTGKNDKLLAFLYGTAPGRGILRILISPAVSKLAGRLLSTKLSARAIEPFVKANQIDMSQCTKQEFSSYNDFFIRELYPDARPVDMDPRAFVSPCDAKLTIYPIMRGSRFWIKNGQYSIESLLKDKELAEQFEGGSLWMFRLSVEDYHRYIYPMDAAKSYQRKIPGVFHTVQPLAAETYPIYKENTREYCLLKSKQFGSVVMMEVGAMMVGRIKNHQQGTGRAVRGKEKGYFEFGGSTILLMTTRNAVKPKREIAFNSVRGFETVVKQGQKVGSVWESYQ